MPMEKPTVTSLMPTNLMPADNSKPERACRAGAPFFQPSFRVRIAWAMPAWMAIVILILQQSPARSQLLASKENSSSVSAANMAASPRLSYSLPTEKAKFDDYVLDAYGPFPIVGSAVAAGINQLGNAPPEWKQGAEGFGKRFGSDFAIAAVGTTTRYGLAEVLREDTLYYRCECTGFAPRIGHAVLSTFTARRGADGHRVFSVPALLAPYAGSMTAVYGWYPNRFGAMDGFRIGNYNLLVSMGVDIGLEFFSGGPHSLLSRLHLGSTRGSPAEGPNR